MENKLLSRLVGGIIFCAGGVYLLVQHNWLAGGLVLLAGAVLLWFSART